MHGATGAKVERGKVELVPTITLHVYGIEFYWFTPGAGVNIEVVTKVPIVGVVVVIVREDEAEKVRALGDWVSEAELGVIVIT